MKKRIIFYLLLVACCLGKAQPYGYTYMKSVTISSAVVSGTTNLTNYPLLISITDASLRSTANGGYVTNSNGYDIVFTSGTCTSLLPHEIESYDPLTGRLVCWVKLPTLTYSANTVIQVYYGNPTVTVASASPALVWNSDYTAVYHLSDDPTTSAPQMNNPVSAATSGSCLGGMTSTNSVAGIAGSCILFDETDDAIRVPDLNYTESFAISFWFYLSEVSGTQFQYLYSHGAFSSTNSINCYFGESTTTVVSDRLMLKTVFQDSNDGTNFNILDAGNGHVNTLWHQYYMVVGNTGGAIVYVDGVVTGSYSVLGGDPYNPATDFFIGARADLNTDRFYGGRIDEFRIMNVPPSVNWFRTEYNNINPSTEYITFGTQQTASAACVFLPIELINFEARAESDSLSLYWLTESEWDNDYFTLEKSTDGILFNDVQQIKGAGTTKQQSAYAVKDVLPHSTSYYRLKQTDYNKNAMYSHIIVVDAVSNSGRSYLSPNPAEGQVTLHVLPDAKRLVGTINVFNPAGNLVYSQPATENLQDNKIELRPGSLNPGFYYVEFNNPEPQRLKLILK